MLADALPDRFGDQVMNAWLTSQGREPGTANPVERLCYTGVRGIRSEIPAVRITGCDPFGVVRHLVVSSYRL